VLFLNQNSEKGDEIRVDDQELLDQAVNFAEFMSSCFSDNVEVVVHDMRGDLDHSAIAFFNNHVSGRQVGAPLTKTVVQFLTEEQYENVKSVCNYQGVTSNGKSLRSSTYFVKNQQGRTIGCVCVNVDLSKYLDAAQMLDKLISFDAHDAPPELAGSGENDEGLIREYFSHSIADDIGHAIAEYTKQTETKLSQFSTEDKIAVVTVMKKKGLFSYKGSIREVSNALGISEPTLYRYLKK
jgi:predicted transcriptional regulator YheO